MTFRAARMRHVAFVAAASLVLGTAGSLAIALPASAAIAPVDSLTDDGVGFTLREAVLQANADAGADVITFAPALSGGTIVIDSALSVTEALTITGPGSGELTVVRGGAASFSMFSFQPPNPDQDLTLSGLRIAGDGVKTGSGLTVGGALSLPRNVTIDDVTFDSLRNNEGAGVSAGGLSGALTVSNSLFQRNVAVVDGGGVWAFGALAVAITDTGFVENSAPASSGGAAFFKDAGVITVTDSTFDRNAALQGGGALYSYQSDSVTVAGGYFRENQSSANRGGAAVIEMVAGSVTITSEFTQNDAALSGGALMLADVAGTTTVTDSTFTDNRSDDTGGGAIALLSDLGPVMLANSTFTGNQTFGVGGALYAMSVERDLTVLSSTFRGNRADRGAGGADGGAIYVEAVGGDATLAVDSSTFTENTLNMGELSTGGGVSLAVKEVQTGGSVRIINSTAYEPAQGTAFSLRVREVQEGGSFEVVHSTIVANGGLWVDDAVGRVSVAHSIIDGNVLPVNAPGFLLQSGGPIHLAWSVVTDALDAPNVSDEGGNQFSIANLKLGPLQNNGGPTRTMLPLPGSPAIDRGDPAVVGAPSFDQRGAGFARILGGRIDVGAVEAPARLAATGLTIGILVPIIGGVLLLAGIAAIVFTRLRRNKAGDRPE